MPPDQLSHAAPLKDSNFDVIPLDVITAWLDGKYSHRPQRPPFYDALGWALMLRGCYYYETSSKKKPESWGFSLFDLDDGEFYAAGIRLHSDKKVPTEIRDVPHPLLWRTELCKIRPRNEPPTLMTIYRLMIDEGPTASKVHKHFSPLLHPAKTPRPELDIPSRLVDMSITYLQERFETDWNELERMEKCIYGVFEMPLRKFTRLEHVQFSGVFRDENLKPAGQCNFKRII